jgi:excisionase family DNA binding protein
MLPKFATFGHPNRRPDRTVGPRVAQLATSRTLMCMSDARERPSDPEDPYWTVGEAADVLGCSAQTVRNRLRDGELEGHRVRRGKRSDIYMVRARSVRHHLETHGSAGRRPSQSTPSQGRLEELEARVHALELLLAQDAKGHAVNLRYANLRLLAIQESYGKAIRELSIVDEHRRQALELLEQAASEYRAVIEQFNLPSGPPADG